MRVEERVAADLAVVEERAGTPTVDVAALVRVGRRERTRARWVRAGAVSVAGAVAVAAVAVTTSVMSQPERRTAPATDPTTATSAPVAPVAAPMPYWADGAVHTGDATFPVAQPDGLYHRGATTVVVQGGVYTLLLDGQQPTVVPVVAPNGDFAVSADGRWLAWVDTSTEGIDRFTAYDVTAGAVVDTLDLEKAAGRCCKPRSFYSLVGLFDDGRVVIGGYDVTLPEVWTPGGSVVTGELPLDARTYVSRTVDLPPPNGFVVENDRGRTLDTTTYTVDAEGTATAGATVDGTQGSWSPDGRFLVSLAMEVNEVDGTTATITGILPRPEGPGADKWTVVGWESPTELVFSSAAQFRDDSNFEARPADLVRCDVETLACEDVAGVPDGPLVLPKPNYFGSW